MVQVDTHRPLASVRACIVSCAAGGWQEYRGKIPDPIPKLPRLSTWMSYLTSHTRSRRCSRSGPARVTAVVIWGEAAAVQEQDIKRAKVSKVTVTLERLPNFFSSLDDVQTRSHTKRGSVAPSSSAALRQALLHQSWGPWQPAQHVMWTEPWHLPF